MCAPRFMDNAAKAQGSGTKYRKLGRTGLRVRSVGFGACAIGGDHGAWGYGPTDDAESVRAISTAVELGCNFFDTADAYGRGHSERLLGQVLGGSTRSRVYIATKIGYVFDNAAVYQDFRPASIRKAVEASLGRLRTEVIDLLQLHNPPREVVLDRQTADALVDLQHCGKIRFVGVSAGNIDDGVASLEAPWVDAIQVRYNILEPDAGNRLFPAAAKLNIGVIAREPLANGFLTGKYNRSSTFPSSDFRSFWNDDRKACLNDRVQHIRQLVPAGESIASYAIKWTLALPAISVVIPGCKTSEQVRQNLSV